MSAEQVRLRPSPERRDLRARAEFRARVEREYHEMAGLSLTLGQAMRLFHLEGPRCERLLRELLDTGFLRRSDDGSYARNQ